MQVKKTVVSDTQVTLEIIASQTDIEPIKLLVIKRLGGQIKVAGFRPGKAPLPILEKQLDPSGLQTEFLNEALNQLYSLALDEYNLRPVDRPKINIKKFVPFTTLEFEAELEVVGDIKLADYKIIKKLPEVVIVTEQDIKEVLSSLQKRVAERSDVDRVAKNGDEVWIDFVGKDTKDQPIKGGEGKDYPLILGSNTFIPGFEAHLVGLKSGAEKVFTLTFPKEYAVKALAHKKVTFTVQVKKVQEITEPKLDDAFAAQAGPFISLADLKADIKKQIKHERQQAATNKFQTDLVRDITAKSTVAVPRSLIDEQIERLVQEVKRNITYRGQTWTEFLDTQGVSDEDYRKNILTPEATERVKAGLVLSEIAQKEGLHVTEEEVEARIMHLKTQHQDTSMQAELNKPTARGELASRILTEKTLNLLMSFTK